MYELLQCTDLGNAERFVERFGADWRYCAAEGRWYRWNGKRWRFDDREAVVAEAKAIPDEIMSEAAGLGDGGKDLARWAQTSASAERLLAMLKLARSASAIAVTPRQFDRDPMLLAVRNGTIDLRTGERRPHDPTDYITKLAPVIHDPDAKCPTWDAALQLWLPDPAVRSFFQRACGYGATADVSEQALFFLYGDTGANGKSTSLRTIQETLGDYAAQAAPNLLLQSPGERHPTEIADLMGVRFVASVEVEDGKRLAEVLVKQLTGGDRLKARRMRQDFFEFDPTFKLFLAANHKPIIRGTDKAIWRRIHLIPFTVHIPPDQRDRALMAKLRRERSGILRWLIDGCLAWQEHGLDVPDCIKEATNAYKEEQDIIGLFIEEYCERDPSYEVRANLLYQHYTGWANSAGLRPLSVVRFGEELARHGLEPARIGHGGHRGWRGLRIRSAAEDGVLTDLYRVATGKN